ncbi:MAG: hypothetical protein P8Y50_05935 [Sulfurovaceae bacterium]
MNDLKSLWDKIKPSKIKRTTFGVVSSHIISTTFLFPAFWIIVGSFAKFFLVEKGMLSQSVAMWLYYAIMLGCFYLGIKYSLYYIDKRVSVALPKQSGRQSIIIFTMLVIVVDTILFYYEQTVNFQRIIFGLLLIYMFAKLTKRYFNSLEQAEYLECNFLSQIVVLLANLSILIVLLLAYAIIHELNPIANMLALIIVFYLASTIESFDKIFVPFFYMPDEPKPIKKALLALLITLPINAILWSIAFDYMQKRFF